MHLRRGPAGMTLAPYTPLKRNQVFPNPMLIFPIISCITLPTLGLEEAERSR